MKYIAFVCGHNTGRSQMAMAIFNQLKKINKQIDAEYEAISFGTGIGKEINPRIIQPLKEIGIDIEGKQQYFPKSSDHPSIKKKYDKIELFFTMGCMEGACNVLKKTKIKADWNLEDPANKNTNIDQVKNQIIENVLKLIQELNK